MSGDCLAANVKVCKELNARGKKRSMNDYPHVMKLCRTSVFNKGGAFNDGAGTELKHFSFDNLVQKLERERLLTTEMLTIPDLMSVSVAKALVAAELEAVLKEYLRTNRLTDAIKASYLCWLEVYISIADELISLGERDEFPYLKKSPCLSSSGGTSWVKDRSAKTQGDRAAS
jgi:hypothetical protein